MRMHADEIAVDADLVRGLLRSQLPSIADLALVPVQPWGTDNAIWRLGEELVVRLPRIGWAAGQPAHDARVLTRIAPFLPVAVPEPVAIGEPGAGFPYSWAVHRWVGGEAADPRTAADPVRFALDLADALRALGSIDPHDAPVARGRALALRDYEQSALEAIDGASGLVDAEAARAVWEEAVAAPPHQGPGVWVHGDLEGNCLVSDGRLSGIVDWGSACAGDPAVDVQVIWSPLFTPASRAAFLEALGVDEPTVLRSRGAAVQQACAALPYYLDSSPQIVERSRHKLNALGIEVRARPGR